MHNKLEPIYQQKLIEVAALQQQLADDATHPIHALLNAAPHFKPPASFKSALENHKLAVIAEIKRKSPSKGFLSPIPDPIELAKKYIEGGANALSILTDQKFFAGHIDDLAQVAPVATMKQVPILRKDFIIDKIQIAEAALAGASAILCIIALVGAQAKELISFAHSLQLDVLVEVHDRAEVEIALACGADIIGVNNRNLTTFEVDIQQAIHVLPAIPADMIKIAESGILSPELARNYHLAGFNAVLIGEALVTSPHPEQFIKACQDGK